MWVFQRGSLCLPAEMPPGSQNIKFDGGCDYPPVSENPVWGFLCHAYLSINDTLISAIDDSSSFLPLPSPPIGWKFHGNIDHVCRLTIIFPALSLVHSRYARNICWSNEWLNISLCFIDEEAEAQRGLASWWQSWDKKSGLLVPRLASILSVFLYVLSILELECLGVWSNPFIPQMRNRGLERRRTHPGSQTKAPAEPGLEPRSPDSQASALSL